jgi:hypothetical protein
VSDYFDKRLDRVFGLSNLVFPQLQSLIADPFGRRDPAMPRLGASDAPPLELARPQPAAATAAPAVRTPDPAPADNSASSRAQPAAAYETAAAGDSPEPTSRSSPSIGGNDISASDTAAAPSHSVFSWSAPDIQEGNEAPERAAPAGAPAWQSLPSPIRDPREGYQDLAGSAPSTIAAHATGDPVFREDAPAIPQHSESVVGPKKLEPSVAGRPAEPEPSPGDAETLMENAGTDRPASIPLSAPVSFPSPHVQAETAAAPSQGDSFTPTRGGSDARFPAPAEAKIEDHADRATSPVMSGAATRSSAPMPPVDASGGPAGVEATLTMQRRAAGQGDMIPGPSSIGFVGGDIVGRSLPPVAAGGISVPISTSAPAGDIIAQAQPLQSAGGVWVGTGDPVGHAESKGTSPIRTAGPTDSESAEMILVDRNASAMPPTGDHFPDHSGIVPPHAGAESSLPDSAGHEPPMPALPAPIASRADDAAKLFPATPATQIAEADPAANRGENHTTPRPAHSRGADPLDGVVGTAAVSVPLPEVPVPAKPEQDRRHEAANGDAPGDRPGHAGRSKSTAAESGVRARPHAEVPAGRDVSPQAARTAGIPADREEAEEHSRKDLRSSLPHDVGSRPSFIGTAESSDRKEHGSSGTSSASDLHAGPRTPRSFPSALSQADAQAPGQAALAEPAPDAAFHGIDTKIAPTPRQPAPAPSQPQQKPAITKDSAAAAGAETNLHSSAVPAAAAPDKPRAEPAAATPNAMQDQDAAMAPSPPRLTRRAGDAPDRPDATPRHAASSASVPDMQPQLRVRIGRIEIHRPPDPVSTPAPMPPRPTALSLSGYLQRKGKKS